MKLQIMSDLHLEFGHMNLSPYGDVLILAGDIGVVKKWSTIELIEEWAKDFEQVIYVPGNHEYYKGDLDISFDKLKKWSSWIDNLVVLNDDVYIFDGVIFIGSTLWSNLTDTVDAAHAKLWMNDYKSIRVNNYERPLSPAVTTTKHIKSVAFLRDAMKLWRSFNHKMVVITHHLPSFKSVPKAFEKHVLNPAFATNLEDEIALGRPNLWVHGHTHTSFDYKIHDTRIICNPRGYVGHEMNEDFDKTLTVEI